MKRQLIFQCIELFTSTHKSSFHTKVFDTIDLSDFPEFLLSKYGPKGYSMHALFRAIIVMKCEKFPYITDLIDYLNNNLYIAYHCGFDIMKPLPSYWTFERFIKNTAHQYFSKVIQNLVLHLKELGFIDNAFVSADVTPIFANTKFNNPKSFAKSKFNKANPSKSDKSCKLGVHTASNAHNEKIFEYYWG